MKKENIFSVEAVNRQKEQEAIENVIGLNVPSNHKVKLNINLPPEHKHKLKEYAKKKHLSIAVIVQMWIEKYCE